MNMSECILNIALNEMEISPLHPTYGPIMRYGFLEGLNTALDIPLDEFETQNRTFLLLLAEALK